MKKPDPKEIEARAESGTLLLIYIAVILALALALTGCASSSRAGDEFLFNALAKNAVFKVDESRGTEGGGR